MAVCRLVLLFVGGPGVAPPPGGGSPGAFAPPHPAKPGMCAGGGRAVLRVLERAGVRPRRARTRPPATPNHTPPPPPRTRTDDTRFERNGTVERDRVGALDDDRRA